MLCSLTQALLRDLAEADRENEDADRKVEMEYIRKVDELGEEKSRALVCCLHQDLEQLLCWLQTFLVANYKSQSRKKLR